MWLDQLKQHGEVEGYATIWVCQGPPWCDLTGDNAMSVQMDGCPFCKQIRVVDDGSETVIEPGTA